MRKTDLSLFTATLVFGSLILAGPSGCDQEKLPADTPKSATGAPTTRPAAVTTTRPAQAAAPATSQPLSTGTVKVIMETNFGKVTMELDREKAPITVDNFLKYVDEKFYDGTIFHRVIPTFMIQGGGFLPGMKQKQTHAQIKNEAKNGLKNVRGSIAMARTPQPHSASSQFFINVKDNTFLNYPGQDGWGYCVFGMVTEGMDVVDKIKDVPTGQSGPHGDVPRQDVVIKSIRRAAEAQ